MNLDLQPGWASYEGPEEDVVVSTRARLARNLSGQVYPGRASADALIEVAELVRAAVLSLGKHLPGLQIIDLKDLGEAEREYLVDAHLASYEQVEPGDGRLIILNSEGSIAIMVNEEDHLRIQAILPGLQPGPAWEHVDKVDDCLAGVLRYDYSEGYGYLTASLSNVGTGLRISTMLHLAGLAAAGRVARTLKAAYELGISVRGLFGEGTGGHGDFYQVSNEVTLGLPEREIVHRVRAVAQHLIGEERRARQMLAESSRKKCAERALQSLESLRRMKSVGAVEALALLSPIRLAAAMGIAQGGNPRLFNELLISMGIGRLTGARRVSWDAVKMEISRASKIWSKLKELTVDL